MQLDQEAHSAILDTQVPRVRLDGLDLQEPLDLQDLRDELEALDGLVLRVHKVVLEELDGQVHKDRRVELVELDTQVCDCILIFSTIYF